MNAERNTNIDCAKAIAAFFVVFIHVKFPDSTGIAIDAISRFSVALFFIISGYFAYFPDPMKSMEVAKRQVRKISLLAVAATAMYLLFSMVCKIPYEPCGFSKMAVDLLIFNRPSGILGFCDPLWFLYALLYCHIIMLALHKTKLFKKIYAFAFLLLIIHFTARISFRLLLPEDSPCNQIFILRNFAFFGFPFYMVGHLIHKTEKQLSFARNHVLLGSIFLSTPLTLAELFLTGRNSVYIGTSICAISIMILCVRNKNLKKLGLLAVIGRKYSALIYILHPVLWSILPYFLFHIGLWPNQMMAWTIPVVMIAVSLIGAYAVQTTYSFVRAAAKHATGS